MTADRRDDAGVRLHVGGLARGVDPKELAALIARLLPSGASPTAEIMRDASTGIERGFGYVSVPSGEGVRAGAERAIAAYNGSRWRGSKIRVGLAKGDYMQRLKTEWDEAAKAKQATAVAAAAAEAARKPSATMPYKARPSLRLRRRPGERIILVDPTPVAWTKPPRQDARSRNKAKEKEAKEDMQREGDVREGAGEEGGDEGGPHRRKRGVLGCRRRVEFPGRGATCSTKCRELWRRHLQEQAAEISAAQQRSVDLFISGKDDEALAAAAVDASNGEASPRVEATEEQESAEYLPGEDAAGLVPEEPPAADGIEFVWDDAAEDGTESGADGVGEEDESGDSDGTRDGEQDGQENSYHMPVSGLALAAGLGGQANQEQAEEREQDEAHAAENGGGAPLATSQVWGGAPAVRAASRKLERLGSKHGVELDERLAELLSDGSDDDGDGAYGDGGYDYELETAKRAGITETKAAVGEPVEGMRDRLQAEAERSLGVLDSLFGSGRAPHARPNGDAPGASCPTAPRLESAAAGVDNSGDSKAVPPSASNTQKAHMRDSGDVVLPKPEEQQQQQQATLPDEGEGETPLLGAGGAAGSTTEVPGEERFVAHMPKLTDIFTVRDKVSTKKSKEEKDRDKGFKVASLFDGLAGAGEPRPDAEAAAEAAAAATPGAGAGGFSFAFSSGAVGTTAAHTEAGDGAITGSAAGQNEQPPWRRQSPGVDPASGPAEEHDTRSSAGSALQGTERALWRPLGDVVAVGARFVRTGNREQVEAAWLGERRALTQDFKRKHKDAVKGRRGTGAGGAALKKRKRR
eukprot:g14741.t1